MMDVTADCRGNELSVNEWADIRRGSNFLAFRRNAINVRLSGVNFHMEVYDVHRQIIAYLNEHMTDLWFLDGASNDGYRILYLLCPDDAVAFRLRWHNTTA